MPFFHATYRDRLETIQREGLLPVHAGKRNFPGSRPGVYLSTDAFLTFGFFLETLGVFLDAIIPELKEAAPSEVLDNFCVIVIDRSRVDEKFLIHDPQIDMFTGTFWLYQKPIDVSGMPIISIDEGR